MPMARPLSAMRHCFRVSIRSSQPATVGTTNLTSNKSVITWTAGQHTSFLTLNLSPTSVMVGKPVTLVGSLSDVSVTPAITGRRRQRPAHVGREFLLRHHQRQGQRLLHIDADLPRNLPVDRELQRQPDFAASYRYRSDSTSRRRRLRFQRSRREPTGTATSTPRATPTRTPIPTPIVTHTPTPTPTPMP